MISSLHKRVVQKWKTYALERWWGDYIDIRFLLVNKLSHLGGQKILDVGCNAGIIASEAASNGNEVVGLDYNLDALWEYRHLFREIKLVPEIVCGSWNQLMFKEMCFDSMILSWVIYEDKTYTIKKETIAALRRLLKPGGSIYFVESNRLCPIQGRGLEPLWSPEEARDFFVSQGFDVEELLGWNPLPSLFFWLPYKIKIRLPRALLLYFSLPGRLLQYIPGWYAFFRVVGKYRFIWKYCRTYYIRAKKLDLESTVKGIGSS